MHTCELLLAFIMLFLCIKFGNKLGKFTLSFLAFIILYSHKNGHNMSGEDLKDSGEKGCAEGVRGSRVGRAVRKDSSSRAFKEAAE